MTTRFNIELHDDYKIIVDQLRQKTGLRNQKDVFESALAIFGWAVRETSRGRAIASLDEDAQTYVVIHTPALMNVEATRSVPAPPPPASVTTPRTSP